MIIADYNGGFFGLIFGLPLAAVGVILLLIGAMMASGSPAENKNREAKIFAWAGASLIGVAVVIAILGKRYGP